MAGHFSGFLLAESISACLVCTLFHCGSLTAPLTSRRSGSLHHMHCRSLGPLLWGAARGSRRKIPLSVDNLRLVSLILGSSALLGREAFLCWPSLRPKLWKTLSRHCKVGHYKRTVKRIDDGHRLCNDLMNCLQDRAKIEKAYSQQLTDWAKRWRQLVEKGPQYGTLERAWCALLTEAEKVGELHQDVRNRLVSDDVEKVRNWQKEAFHKQMIGGFKETKEAEDGFRKAQKPWAKKIKEVEAAKKAYHMACKEENLASSREATGKADASVTADQQRKLQDKVEKCKQDVHKCHEKRDRGIKDVEGMASHSFENVIKQTLEEPEWLELTRFGLRSQILFGVQENTNLLYVKDFSNPFFGLIRVMPYCTSTAYNTPNVESWNINPVAIFSPNVQPHRLTWFPSFSPLLNKMGNKVTTDNIPNSELLKYGGEARQHKHALVLSPATLRSAFKPFQEEKEISTIPSSGADAKRPGFLGPYKRQHGHAPHTTHSQSHLNPVFHLKPPSDDHHGLDSCLRGQSRMQGLKLQPHVAMSSQMHTIIQVFSRLVEAFWDWTVGHYKRTVKRIDDGHRLCNDLMNCLQDRAKIEKAYSQQLTDWAKRWRQLVEKGPQYGTLERAWCALLTEAEKVGELHQDVRNRLVSDDVEKVRNWQKEAFHKQMIGGFKETKEAEDGFRKAQKPWAKKIKEVEAAKKAYHMACKEENLASSREATGKADASVTADQQRKLQDKVEKCKQDVHKAQERYEKVLDDIQKFTPQYMESMDLVFEQCQQLEEKRLVFLKEILLDIKHHLNLAESNSYAAVYNELEKSIQSSDVQEDLRWFRASHGPGMHMNWPQLEEWNTDYTHSIPRKEKAQKVEGGALTNVMSTSDNSSQGGDRGSVSSYEKAQLYTADWSDDEGGSSPYPAADSNEVTNQYDEESTWKVRVRALYDYEGQEQDELSFKAGEELTKLEDEDEQGWCRGQLDNGRQGLYPANYVEPI
ncbi:kinase C and casein kinase substrate in neurons 1 [Pelobates cultripes]|uniref:Protein kinase C and casein kinase substrate in neurons protein 1 n=1 Tax=Pelobates cultripes TaxID=61616 RepID=A0AAD1R0A2_PELCU|nr:kinase C and casein kinase substrate in neurons 1 [Pelobates cultripes]